MLSLPIDLLSMEQTVRRVEELVESGGITQHVVLNAAKVVQAQRDPELRRAIEACHIINADGMSVVWAARLLGIGVPERVAGIDLMDRLLSLAALRGWPVYLLGARSEVVQRVAALEQKRHRNLRVVGFRDGYWAPEAEAEVVREVAQAAPTLLFVAMPSPAKENFLARHREVLKVPFVMGVGGSFDVVAGYTKRAPQWMQRSGLEWLFRLLQEPERLAGRYLIGNSRFIALVCKEWWLRRFRNPPQS